MGIFIIKELILKERDCDARSYLSSTQMAVATKADGLRTRQPQAIISQHQITLHYITTLFLQCYSFSSLYINESPIAVTTIPAPEEQYQIQQSPLGTVLRRRRCRLQQSFRFQLKYLQLLSRLYSRTVITPSAPRDCRKTELFIKQIVKELSILKLFIHKRRETTTPTAVTAAPTGMAVAKTADIPRDWAIANALPAATLPIPACRPAATEPAATPAVVKPMQERAAPAAEVATPIAASIAIGLRQQSNRLRAYIGCRKTRKSIIQKCRIWSTTSPRKAVMYSQLRLDLSASPSHSSQATALRLSRSYFFSFFDTLQNPSSRSWQSLRGQPSFLLQATSCSKLAKSPSLSASAQEIPFTRRRESRLMILTRRWQQQASTDCRKSRSRKRVSLIFYDWQESSHNRSSSFRKRLSPNFSSGDINLSYSSCLGLRSTRSLQDLRRHSSGTNASRNKVQLVLRSRPSSRQKLKRPSGHSSSDEGYSSRCWCSARMMPPKFRNYLLRSRTSRQQYRPSFPLRGVSLPPISSSRSVKSVGSLRWRSFSPASKRRCLKLWQAHEMKLLLIGVLPCSLKPQKSLSSKWNYSFQRQGSWPQQTSMGGIWYSASRASCSDPATVRSCCSCTSLLKSVTQSWCWNRGWRGEPPPPENLTLTEAQTEGWKSRTAARRIRMARLVVLPTVMKGSMLLRELLRHMMVVLSLEKHWTSTRSEQKHMQAAQLRKKTLRKPGSSGIILRTRAMESTAITKKETMTATSMKAETQVDCTEQTPYTVSPMLLLPQLPATITQSRRMAVPCMYRGLRKRPRCRECRVCSIMFTKSRPLQMQMALPQTRLKNPVASQKAANEGGTLLLCLLLAQQMLVDRQDTASTQLKIDTRKITSPGWLRVSRTRI